MDIDPLNAMVLLAEPPSPGSLIAARPVCVFSMHDEHGPEAKILAVAGGNSQYADVRGLPDVPGHLRAEISHFSDVYKELEPGKSANARGWQGRVAAEQVNAAAFISGHGHEAASWRWG